MAEKFKIAIIGSGPGGLSAAGHAAELGVSHILLERTDHLSDTIFKYQKGKHVMATPDILPLRSPMDFEAGTRENILGIWNTTTEKLAVNVRYNSELTKVTGEKGSFQLTINRKNTIEAEVIVLAIGLQGNLNKLPIEGADWERVQYQLDDPEEYEDETIVVIGAGDAAIENAVALSVQNNVIIINRSPEFARAKDGNIKLIHEAIDSGTIRCMYESSPASIAPGEITMTTKAGTEIVTCDRIIARLGASPPRKFVESCGIVFPSEDRMALPELSPQYESNVPGIYIIGALGGYPLIKQAMNQGYEVVEFAIGNKIKPADEPLLVGRFGLLLNRFDVDQAIDWFRQQVPLISGLTALQLREFFIDSKVHVLAPGQTVFELGEFGDTIFMIAEGGVNVQVDPDNPSFLVPLGEGKFFGEVAMVSARPRTATVLAADNCVLIEAPRRTMIKMMNSVRSVKAQIREAAMARQFRVYLSQNIGDELMSDVLSTAERREYKPGQQIFREGDDADGIFVVRKGALVMSQASGGGEAFKGYVSAGSFIGEMGVIGGRKRSMTVRAATSAHVTWIESSKFMRIVDELPDFRQQVDEIILVRLAENQAAHNDLERGRIAQFLIDQGMGEATDILLIDEALCVGCDNCEKACAETHGGVSRLKRESGATFANLHIPMACRHCEDPYCMSDCPADAIHRAQTGQVFIDEKCIGCGNCKSNCPYNAIEMSYPAPEKPGLLSWLFLGLGSGPGQGKGAGSVPQGDMPKLAVKCDSCKDIDGGPSCVRACPTGAAFRVAPDEYFVSARLT